MKHLVTSLFLFVVTLSVTAQKKQLTIGEQATRADLKMNGINEAYASLSDLMQPNGLIVIFSCNTCPFVLAWENRYNKIGESASENKIGVVLLNSNYLKRDDDDSLEAMQQHAVEKGYSMPYLVDKESVIANDWGAQTTPHVFFFDHNFRLVYKGAIDDNFKNQAEVKRHYLEDAINEVGQGKPVKNPETKPLGCSIKRKPID